MQQMSIKGQITKEIDVLPLKLQKKVLEKRPHQTVEEKCVGHVSYYRHVMAYKGVKECRP
jgi:hypothetical protein